MSIARILAMKDAKLSAFQKNTALTLMKFILIKLAMCWFGSCTQSRIGGRV